MSTPAPGERAGFSPFVEPCACFGARSAARAITDLYDRKLAPAGLRATQLAILASIAVRGAPTMNVLAADLGLDASTMTRTLAPLEQAGLVEIRPADDRRVKEATLTTEGRRRLDRGTALWRRAQQELRAKLGADRFERMISDLVEVTRTLRG